MPTCNHITWVNLTDGEHLYLHYGERVAHILEELTEPRIQYPSIIFFLGKYNRDLALRQIFPRNNIRRTQHNGTINLRLDSSTMSADYPIWFADSDPLSKIHSSTGMHTCHDTISKVLGWSTSQSLNPLDIIYYRLIFPFTDVVCIFADDVGGLQAVALMLGRWIRTGSASTLPKEHRPRLVIVTTEEDFSATCTVLEIEDLRHCLQDQEGHSRESVFSSLIVLRLTGDSVSQLARHRRLKEVLLQEVDTCRLLRVQHRTLFSAIHLQAFFRQALTHVAKTVSEPFDPIKTSRIDNTVGQSFEEHLCAFLYQGRRLFIDYMLMASYVVSSLLMDSFPAEGRLQKKLSTVLQ
ncbi:MAG: hypothetical protein Q9216_003225 [Gyalolechia sp. 2 TL-2023]